MSGISNFTYDTRPIATIVNQIRNCPRGGIDLQPKYQRGYIWTNDFKDKLLYSIIRGYPIGNVSVRLRDLNLGPNEKGALQEVVDGQQRLTTIFKFVNNEYKIQSSISRNIIEYIVEYLQDEEDKKLEKLKKRLKNKGKIEIDFSKLPEQIQENIKSFSIAVTQLANATDAEISEYFLYLQNQERLLAGEILSSIPNSSLEKYLDAIKDKECLLAKLSFNNNRRQFDKAVYSILGLVDGQINFGVTDKEVMKFVEGCNELKEDTAEKANYLVTTLNEFIDDTTIKAGTIKCNVRYMKFLLLLIMFKLVDFSENRKEKLLALQEINSKISAFNSAKPESIPNAFNGYDESVIKEYNNLAVIAKGSQKLSRVENRMRILAYYVNNFNNKIVPSGIPIN